MKLRRAYLLLLLLLAGAGLSAQPLANTDSVPSGIITVRRPPVPATFITTVSYDYGDAWAKRRPWERRAKAARKDYNAWLSEPFPPAPVSVDRNEGDSIDPAGDSARVKEYFARSDRPKNFAWAEYSGVIPHYFSWTDTMRLDSARFKYVVDPEGTAVCTPMPWDTTAASSRKLEQAAWPVMRKLWLWYPAQHVSNRTSKMEPCACTVIVTIYAFEVSGEKPPPIIVNSPRKGR